MLLALAGASDFLDGFVARRLNQVSTLGKVIDPVADRLVLGTAVISIVVYGAVPVWLGVVVLVREVAVSLATVALAALGARRMDVVWAGKAGTFGMMVAFPLFLLGDGSGAAAAALRVAAWVIVIPAELFLLSATAAYAPAARRALEDGRRGHRHGPGGGGREPASPGGAGGGL